MRSVKVRSVVRSVKVRRVVRSGCKECGEEC